MYEVTLEIVGNRFIGQMDLFLWNGNNINDLLTKIDNLVVGNQLKYIICM